MMTLSSLQLPVPIAAFERVWPLLEPATRGETTKQYVWYALQRGAKLWTADESALISEIVNYSSGLRAMNVWLAGGKLDEVMEFMPKTIQWGRENGCTQARTIARPGFAKMMPEAKEVGRLFVRDI